MLDLEAMFGERRGRGLFRAGFAIAALCVSVSEARAQQASDTPSPAVPAVVPPVMLPHADMPYPDGETASATVVLTLVINADGSVRSAKTSSGAAPFSSMAEREAAKWMFTPAQRGDVAIAATIRVAVEFTPPKVQTPTPDPIAPTEAEAPKPKTKTEVIDEVRVRAGKDLPPTVVTLGHAEIRQIPGAFGDPFRAIDVLPGVVPTVSGFPYYYIRGAPPGNVGYFVDGVRVPYLFHFAFGPGVIQPAMLERVNLYPGGFPAEWGRYAGAIVEGETTEPRNELFAEGNIRLFDAGAIMEAPFADGKGHVLIGGRYSYTAGILSLVAKEVSVDYHDFNARVTYDLTKRDRLTLLSFGAFDLAAQEKDNRKTILFASEFYRADVRWDHTFDKDTKLRVGATVGFDRTRLEGQRFARNVPTGGRVELTHVINDNAKLRVSGDVWIDNYNADLPNPYTVSEEDYESAQRYFAPHTDFAAGLRADFVLKLPGNIELIPGLRFDVFGSNGETIGAIDPRLTEKIPLSPKTRILIAQGLAHQPPAFPIPVPAVSIRGFDGALQEVFQLSAGVETDLPEGITASLVGFRNGFRNMGDALALSGTNGPFDGAPKHMNGSAYGLELYVRRKLTKHLGGLVSYTLSRSVREFEGRTFINGFDRTHVLNTALTLDLGKNWRFGARFLFYTGVRPFQNTIDDLAGKPITNSDSRLPSFYRIDARLEKKWMLSKTAWISFILEGLNVTANKEVVGLDCPSPGQCTDNSIGPIAIPSIGVEGGL